MDICTLNVNVNNLLVWLFCLYSNMYKNHLHIFATFSMMLTDAPKCSLVHKIVHKSYFIILECF